MNVREISKKPASEHEADAFLFSDPNDFAPEELKLLEKRYPGITETSKAYMSNPKFVEGAVAMKTFGDKNEKVLFACLARSPKIPGYMQIKTIFKKIIETQGKTGVSHIAVGPIGTSAGTSRIHANGIADVIRVAIEGSTLVVDYHYTSPA